MNTAAPNWLPLRRAVFEVGLENTHEDLNPITILKEKTGAERAEIDLTGPEPTFDFVWIDGHRLGGSPWAILAEPIADPVRPGEVPANMKAATAREKAVSAARCQAVRAATSLVWNQFLVRGFDGAISTGAVVLYGRPKTVTADFVQVPADVWTMLEVADWENGIAVAPDGTAYFSIHAVVAPDVQEAADKAVGAEAPSSSDKTSTTAKRKTRNTKRATPEAYAEHQHTHLISTGEYASRREDEAWAKANGYTRDYVRDVLRRRYYESLTVDDQNRFRRASPP
jgi:hypothetical protein